MYLNNLSLHKSAAWQWHSSNYSIFNSYTKFLVPSSLTKKPFSAGSLEKLVEAGFEPKAFWSQADHADHKTLVYHMARRLDGNSHSAVSNNCL